MKPPDDRPSSNEPPRSRAERRVSGRPAEPSDAPAPPDRLLHELRIHQAELEIRNEELRRTQAELAHSLDRYRELYESAPVGYVTVDGRGTILQANHAACEILGTGPEAAAGKASFAGFIAPESQDSWYRHRRDALSGGRQTCEVRLQVRDGAQRTVRLDTASEPAGDGEEQARIVMIDVTERARAEEALVALNSVLEQRVAERTLEVEDLARRLRGMAVELSRVEMRERRRLAGLLHDHIQQLLVAARLQLEWTEMAPAGEISRSTIQGVVAILREAITDLRSLKVELSPPVMQDAGLAGGLQWLAARVEATSELKVDLEIDEGAEPGVEEMRYLLFECARELLFNVVKHSGAGKARVQLRAGAEGRKEIVVEDEGVGFDPQNLARAGHADATFGLFTVQQRLEHAGGALLIDSVPGRGTKVTIISPPESAEGAEVKPRRARTAAGGKAPRIRLVLVDDHKILREGLATLLGTEPDFEVVGEAADGAQAVDLAEKLAPDVILMDVTLPRMSGLDATRIIKTKRPETQVVGLSMHHDKAIAAAMLHAGAAAFLSKGGATGEVVAAIRRCCRPAE